MRKRQLLAAIIITFILGSLADKWKLQWYQVAVPYALGLIAFLLWDILKKASPTNGAVASKLEEMWVEIDDKIKTQPVSPNEISAYVKDCAIFCRENNI